MRYRLRRLSPLQNRTPPPSKYLSCCARTGRSSLTRKRCHSRKRFRSDPSLSDTRLARTGYFVKYVIAQFCAAISTNYSRRQRPSLLATAQLLWPGRTCDRVYGRVLRKTRGGTQGRIRGELGSQTGTTRFASPPTSTEGKATRCDSVEKRSGPASETASSRSRKTGYEENMGSSEIDNRCGHDLSTVLPHSDAMFSLNISLDPDSVVPGFRVYSDSPRSPTGAGCY